MSLPYRQCEGVRRQAGGEWGRGQSVLILSGAAVPQSHWVLIQGGGVPVGRGSGKMGNREKTYLQVYCTGTTRGLVFLYFVFEMYPIRFLVVNVGNSPLLCRLIRDTDSVCADRSGILTQFVQTVQGH